MGRPSRVGRPARRPPRKEPCMDWTVSKQRILVRPHPGADALDLLKVGQHQLVARKGQYRDDDVVLFIAEKSLLPAGPLQEEFGAYLVGAERNRVTHLRLRGEFSGGVTWPLDELHRFGPAVEQAILTAPIGENVAALLGITKYEPPVPQSLAGQVEAIDDAPHFGEHDVLYLGAYLPEFAPDEPVIVTEKLHGSQVNVYVTEAKVTVTSKGLAARGLRILEDAGNTYWRAVRASRLLDLAREAFPGRAVQLFGEVLPVQKGFSYGFDTPVVRLFEVRVDGESVAYRDLSETLRALWVPMLDEGPLDLARIQALAKGQETVSGRALHLKEGVVVRPADPARRAQDGSRLQLKVLNPKYKDADDAIN